MKICSLIGWWLRSRLDFPPKKGKCSLLVNFHFFVIVLHIAVWEVARHVEVMQPADVSRLAIGSTSSARTVSKEVGCPMMFAFCLQFLHYQRGGLAMMLLTSGLHDACLSTAYGPSV